MRRYAFYDEGIYYYNMRKILYLLFFNSDIHIIKFLLKNKKLYYYITFNY